MGTSCINGTSINVPAWYSDKTTPVISSASGITSVRLYNISGGSGYTAYILNNWNFNSPIATQSLPSSGSVDIPISSTTGSIQVRIKHSVGTQSGFAADVELCSGQTPPPPPGGGGNPPTTGTSGNLQSNLPSNPSDTYYDWRDKLVNNLGVSSSGEDCMDLHDRFWVLGDDGRAYHTWHPATYDGCEFGHEHGHDPATSDLFDEIGYPPFGYVFTRHFRQV